MRMPDLVEPGLVVETNRIDDQSVSLPLSNRVAHPAGIQILGMPPPIGPDLADEVAELVDDKHAAGYHENFHGKIEKINSRHAGRVALQGSVVRLARVAARVGRLRGFEFCFRPG